VSANHPPMHCERDDWQSPIAQVVTRHGVSAFPANDLALAEAMTKAALDVEEGRS
jgi:hypothetical protein